jgi:hypothetical protein
MASSWLDCGASVSCSVRRFRFFLEPPHLRRHCHPLRYSLAWSSIDRRFLPPRFILSDHRFLFRPVTLLFYGFMLLPILLFDAYGLGIAQERDPEEGRTVTNLGRSPSGH